MADAYIEKGTTYEIDGKVYECLEFLHVKPGKGSAFVRTKLKDVINNTCIMTVTCIILWIWRLMSRHRWAKTMSATL